MTSHGQSRPRGGGVFVNVFTPPPSGNPVSAPVFHPSKFRPPPPPGWLATGLHSFAKLTTEALQGEGVGLP